MVVPLKYRQVLKVGWVGLRAESLKYISAKPQTISAAHTANKISKDNGPKKLRKVSRVLAALIARATAFQGSHMPR